MSKSLSLIKYLLYAGIFAVPFLAFIVSSSMFFPFHNGKKFFFQIIVEVMTALWLVLMLFDARYKPRKSWVLAMLAIFVGVVALSSIFGENFYRSFWSNYERMEGLVTYLHLLAYFLVLAGTLKTEKVWSWLFNTSLFASVIMAFTAFFNYGEYFRPTKAIGLTPLWATLPTWPSIWCSIYSWLWRFLPGERFQKMDLSFCYRLGIIRSLLYGDQRGDIRYNRRLVDCLDFNRHYFSEQKIKACSRLVASRDDNNCRRFLVFKDNRFYK